MSEPFPLTPEAALLLVAPNGVDGLLDEIAHWRRVATEAKDQRDIAEAKLRRLRHLRDEVANGSFRAFALLIDEVLKEQA